MGKYVSNRTSASNRSKMNQIRRMERNNDFSDPGDAGTREAKIRVDSAYQAKRVRTRQRNTGIKTWLDD